MPLLPASLGTKFLKLPAQHQTLDGVSAICENLAEIELKKGDFVYLDLLSNIIYTVTDDDGHQIPPTRMGTGSGTWRAVLASAQSPESRRF